MKLHENHLIMLTINFQNFIFRTMFRFVSEVIINLAGLEGFINIADKLIIFSSLLFIYFHVF